VAGAAISIGIKVASMKKSRVLLGSLSLCLLGAAAQADCTYPKPPDSIPDGKSAAEAEMLTAMATFKQYNTDVDAYLACLDQETAAKTKEASGAAAIMQIKAMQSKKRSSATDERQAKIDEFNKQVRAFKSKG
jgi:hypothetical protein